MSKPTILLLDDQRDVLAALARDLAVFAPWCELLECESAAEARTVLDELSAGGGELAVIVCDHIMPGENGVDFLAELAADDRFRFAHKVLVTGLATQADTIRAINEARIDRYLQKPWQAAELVTVVREMLTHYVGESDRPYQELLPALDPPTLFRMLRRRT